MLQIKVDLIYGQFKQRIYIVQQEYLTEEIMPKSNLLPT